MRKKLKQEERQAFKVFIKDFRKSNDWIPSKGFDYSVDYNNLMLQSIAIGLIRTLPSL